MTQPTRIYLDNAATSWPKPAAVYEAVDDYMRRLGAPAGRGAYHEADEVERAVALARRRLARLFGLDDSRRVIFGLNGTDALNLAIHGLLREGDHVVTSVVEHNSVLRPLRHWERSGGVSVTRVACDAEGRIDPDDVARAIRPNTRLVALTHVSNVTGAIQPLEAIGRVTREHDCLFLVDAAQSAGHLAVDMTRLSADLLATPTHKALLGPLGGGVLCLGDRAVEQLHPVRQGGTGTDSESDDQPETLPDRFESGNLNTLAIIGVGAALASAENEAEHARVHAAELTERLLAGLGEIPTVRVVGPPRVDNRVGVVSFSADGWDPRDLAAVLDSSYHVQTRAGFHCAPLAHRSLGTADSGGLVRMSLGKFNTAEQVARAVNAVADICR